MRVGEIILNSLQYMKESLDAYIENPVCQSIYAKLEKATYQREEEFIEHLDAHEVSYLDSLLHKEMQYARSTNDAVKLSALTNLYEHLS
ncbi:MAG TPA: sporulation protein [Candidatus Avamphibacillus intestinigallinarum]|nr:sporulation protein [Candidatus Avamphibacillus intestinigallinarum]